jgi:ABC-2 type transport system permease protein
MIAELKHTLRRLRGQTIGWSIGLALYSLMMVSFFSTLQDLSPTIEQLYESYPPELMAFFGDAFELSTPAGYVDTYFFSFMSLIIGIFAVGVGSGLLVGDEEKGILDLVLAHPIGRSALFWARGLAKVIVLSVVLLVSWLSWLLPAGAAGFEATAVELLLPFLPLWAVLVFFSSLAVLLSLVLPSARAAGLVAAALLVANWLLMGLSNLNENLQAFVEYTPLFYYQGGDAMGGLNWSWFLGLLAFALLFTLLAWWLFQRRDIRVGGERSWTLWRPWKRRMNHYEL